MIKKFDDVPTRLDKSFLLRHRLARSSSTRSPAPAPASRRSHRRHPHPDEGAAAGRRAKREEVCEQRKPFNYKTQLCKFFIRGLCNRGTECTFSHDTRAFPCHAYHLRNNCSRKVCRFSHLPITLEQLKQLREEEGCEEFEFMSTFQNSL